jgi:hypothetical protein
MTTLTISQSGAISFIYSDSLATMLDLGHPTIRRASHVEPGPSGRDWEADLSPVGGPVLIGFKLRKDALDAEVAWLKENGW